MRSTPLRLLLRYGFAVTCAAAGVAVRMALESLWGMSYPYLVLHPAILLSAWVGGLGPGLLTTGLCAAAAAYLWMPPLYSVLVDSRADQVSIGAFIGIGVAISVLSELGHRRERATRAIVESIDDGYTDFYTVRPLATSTASSGTMESTVTNTTIIREDTFATRLTGVAGGETLFDATFDGAIGDAGAQTALVNLAAPRGHAVRGAPAVITWSDPVLAGSAAQLLSSSTESTTATQTFEVVTITQTQGAGVQIG